MRFRLFANSGDPDQNSVASDLGALFANYPLGVSGLKWVKPLAFYAARIIEQSWQNLWILNSNNLALDKIRAPRGTFKTFKNL